MINPDEYLSLLTKEGINFFTGVPDSLLKEFCASLDKKKLKIKHVIAANEGGAVGLAIGNYIGTGSIPLIYLQNSGLGNIINPILSLASPKVYSIPMIIIMGWRGAPGIKDEPQHLHQGDIMENLVRTMDFPYEILSKNEKKAFLQTKKALKVAKLKSSPFFIFVNKDTFKKTKPIKNSNSFDLSREEAISQTLSFLPDESLIVSTTGMCSRELYELRVKKNSGNHRDFLTVGGMGHASQIALGISKSLGDRFIFCFDGDGAALMHMGSLAIIGQSKSKNFVHILFNNGVHDSVGGQPTVGLDINFCSISAACGYTFSRKVSSLKQLEKVLKNIKKNRGPYFIEVLVNPGSRNDLGRPNSSPSENKELFMSFLKK